MKRPHVSTKSSRPWLNNSFKVELFSIVLVLLLIGGVLSPILTQARIANISCQNDQTPCSTDANNQLQSLLGQPMLLNGFSDLQASSHLDSIYQINNLSLSMPHTLNVTLTTQPPSYFLVEETQTMATSADGKYQFWSNSILPEDIPQIYLNIDLQNKLQTNIDPSNTSQLHSKILSFLSILKDSQLVYHKLELVDSATIKVWLTSADWALLDLTQLDAIQKLSIVLNHPDFQNQIKTGYNLDLRFQYPLLLKAD